MTEDIFNVNERDVERWNALLNVPFRPFLFALNFSGF